ncbi:MAG: PH domain-containing protein [Verrucomicrobiota bacterium]
MPQDSLIYVIKGQDSEGPYTVDEVLEKIERGDLSYEDTCVIDGETEASVLRKVLDWEDHSASDELQIHPSKLPPGHVLWEGSPTLFSYPVPILIITLAAVGLIAFPAYTLDYWIFFVGAAGLALAYIIVMRMSNDYLVTSKRIEIITGIFAKNSSEILIKDLRAINIRRTGILGLLGIGTVDFYTSGDKPEVSFSDIDRPGDVKALVREIQDA